jgi:hypothetical protein
MVDTIDCDEPFAFVCARLHALLAATHDQPVLRSSVRKSSR